MQKRTLVSLALAAIAVAGCGEDEEAREWRQQEEQTEQRIVANLGAKGFSADDVRRDINEYRKLGFTTGFAESAILTKTTPQIAKQLKEKEGLKTWDIADIVNTDSKADDPRARFDGEQYLLWSANGFSANVFKHAKGIGISLEEATHCRELGFPQQAPHDATGFLKLATNRIKCDDAAKLKQQGLDMAGILDKYAQAVGTDAKSREQYITWGFTDAQIPILLQKEINFDITYNLKTARIHNSTNQERYLKNEELIKFAQSGKLTGELYHQLEKMKVSDKDMVYALIKGKDLNKVKDWVNAGYSVSEMVACEGVGITLYRMLEIGKKGINVAQAVGAVKGQEVLRMYPDLVRK